MSVCEGAPAVLTVNNPNTTSSYSWEDLDGTIRGTLDTFIVDITQTTTFNLFETLDGCTGSTMVTVDVIGTGMTTDSTQFDSICMGGIFVFPVQKTNDIVFNWSIPNGSTGNISDLSCTDCSTPMVIVNQDNQNYTLEIIPANVSAGCDPIEITFNITIRETPRMPNAFTPDGDDENDFFNLVAKNPSDVDRVNIFRIYNRFGNVVYDNGNPTEGWDGMHNGKPAPSDVYLYRIDATLSRGGCPLEIEGEVTLIR